MAMFHRIRGNARVMLAVQPLASISVGLAGTYLSLYQRDLGLSAQSIGFLVTLTNISWILLSLLGGRLTDRLGRKRAILIFDLVGWSVAAVFWMVAKGFWWFFAASLVNGVVSISASAWSCLLVEDSQSADRIHAFNALQLASVFSGFAFPLAGLAVAALGVIPATRLMYAIMIICLTTKVFIQNRFTQESTVGMVRMAATRGQSWRQTAREYGKSFRMIGRNPMALVALFLYALMCFRDTFMAAFSGIYMHESLGIHSAWIAAFPAASAAAQLGILLVVSPRLGSRHRVAGMISGLALAEAGTLLFVFAPVHGFALLTVSAIVTAAGTALMYPALNTLWNNSLGDAERGNAMSLFFLLRGLAIIPAGSVGGALYGRSPVLPFALMAALIAAALALFATIAVRHGGALARQRSGA